jgi:hypothetical protein
MYIQVSRDIVLISENTNRLNNVIGTNRTPCDLLSYKRARFVRLHLPW